MDNISLNIPVNENPQLEAKEEEVYIFKPTPEFQASLKNIVKIAMYLKLPTLTCFINNKTNNMIIVGADINANVFTACKVINNDEQYTSNTIIDEDKPINIDLLMRPEYKKLEDIDDSYDKVVELSQKSLYALSEVKGVTLYIKENEVTLTNGKDIKLKYSRFKESEKMIEYYFILSKTSWETISLVQYKELIRSIDKIEKDKFRQCVFIKQGKIFTYNEFIISETDTSYTDKGYTLTYNVMDILKKLNPEKIMVSKTDEVFSIKVNGCIVSWGQSNSISVEISNLMDLIDLEEKKFLFELEPNEWKKLKLLDTFGTKLEDVCNLEIKDGHIILTKSNQILILEGTTGNQCTIQIEQKQLELAKDLCGKNKQKLFLVQDKEDYFGLFISDSRVLFKLDYKKE